MSRFGLGFSGGVREGNDSYTKILLHMDGSNGGTTFTDDNLGGSAHTWTAHSATTDTAALKFGATGQNCGAAAGYIDTPDHADYALGSGDWTIDFWFNRQGGDGTNRRMAGQMDSGTTFSVYLQMNTSNKVFMQLQTGAGNPVVTGTTAYAAGGWHHVAGVRTGNILRLFLDGVQEGGDVACSGTATNSAATYMVGAGFGGFQWNGYIDEFRLSVGIARWTADFHTALPTQSYGQ